MNNWIYIAIMILTTLLLRVLPFFVIKKPIKNVFVQSFLYYAPYVTLAVMTFPSIIDATSSPIIGVVALVVALILAWKGKSLVVVASVSTLLVLLLEFLIGK